MTTLTVDPAQYAVAASDLTEVARQTQSAIGLLSGALGASGGMGGSDNAGVEWAQSYDQGAHSVLDAASSAVGAAASVALRLHATGANHAHADASSTIGGGDASIPGAPTPPMISCPSVPSASGGGGGDEPPGWGLVSGMVGNLWPNGHQDRLHAADGAWKAAASGLQLAAGPTAAAASRVQAQQSPESAAAAQACTDTGNYLRELSTVCVQLGNSCSEYAGHLDQAHHEIISTLRELLIETAAIEAAGAAFAIFTAGLDEIAAQASVTARIATAVAKIRRVIEVLIDAARAVAAAVKSYAARAAELLVKLRPLATGAVKTATSKAVKIGKDATVAVARAAPKNFATGAAGEAAKEGVLTVETGDNHFDPTRIASQGATNVFTAPAAQKIVTSSPLGAKVGDTPGGTFGANTLVNGQLKSLQQDVQQAISPGLSNATEQTKASDLARALPSSLDSQYTYLQGSEQQSPAQQHESEDGEPGHGDAAGPGFGR